jgi:putative sterol carrier protein
LKAEGGRASAIGGARGGWRRVDGGGAMGHNRYQIGRALMSAPFPSEAWVDRLVTVLNKDARYGDIARNWEGDLLFVIKPDGGSAESGAGGSSHVHLDLWHGKCRGGRYLAPGAVDLPKSAFTLTAGLSQFMAILGGSLDPMQAMLTRRLQVSGNMAYILRNVPVVLDFVRCCRLAVEAD